MNEYGIANYPITLKTSTVIQDGLNQKTIEKVYKQELDLPVQTIGTVVDSRKLVSSTNEPYGGGTWKQTLVYEKQYAGTTDPLPSTTYDESTSYVELDIRQHPKFDSDLKTSWDSDKGEFKPTSAYYGMSSYIVGSTTVTKTEYFRTQPTSDYTSVGTLQAPGGGFSTTSKWLIIGTSRRKLSDNLYTKETSYLYSAKGYNATIYS